MATSALGLAACGGDDDTETTVAPDASAAVPATTTSAAAPTGKGTPEEQASAVATAYIAAFSAGDAKAVCELFTPAERRRVATASGDDCQEGIRTAFAQGGGAEGFQQSLGGLKVGSATVKGSRAVVRLVAVQAGSAAPPADGARAGREVLAHLASGRRGLSAGRRGRPPRRRSPDAGPARRRPLRP